ncbi:hypothetical protein QA644_33750 (plasmid) [Rhizobium sp. CC1099]|uniref:hypothetical protein n=1 Tax=Rhizobium sp. CC1099 TaxID=3039160 RepID=UPI0024B13785|nr:hypothetical protein [Rhizobium sp. CC1099]WFU92161.1 hypothetical protein QA644_33750 [Rhizobium sp. CC1099]
MAPPLPGLACDGPGSELTNGSLASFIILALTLVIIAATRQRRTRARQRSWFVLALWLFATSIILIPAYVVARQSLTAPVIDTGPGLSGNRAVIGLWAEAESLRKALGCGYDSSTAMIRFFGCDAVVPQLWTLQAVIVSYLLLMTLYLACLLVIVTCLLSISEGVFGEFQHL